MVYYRQEECAMKIFDKYFQPYTEYCLRTTLSEEELKEALAQECPATSDVLSWKAVKAKDYRRAALELLDSRDFNSNINNRNTRGMAIRRRDAAIELSQLAEAMIKK